MARRLPDDPDKRRLQVFKRFYQHMEHWQALIEDRGMDVVITDPATQEDIYIGDLLVGREELPARQRQAFDLICLRGYTESAARDEIMPNSKSSTPVQQYADSGLVRMVRAYDAKQAGQWPLPAEPKPIKKPKRRFFIMAALHPIIRQSMEATRKRIASEIDNLRAALKQLDEMLAADEGAKASSSPPPASLTSTTNGSAEKPDLKTVAKEMTAAAMAE